MNMLFGRNAAAATAIWATVVGFSALALAAPAPAAPMSIDRLIGVSDCGTPKGVQLCPKIPSVVVEPGTPTMKVEFTANREHCSDIIAHIMLDGREWGSNRVGPGQRDGGYEIPVSAGAHDVGVQAEGIPGGCNTIGLQTWSGNLHVEALPA